MNFKLDFNLFNIIVIIFMIYVMFRLPSVEKMSNIDKATEDKIREIYKIDTDAIRNLSNLAKDLTVGGKLTVPGGLDITGNMKVNKSMIGNDPNGFLELRGGTPYIDFSHHETDGDNDNRIILQNKNLIVTKNMQINGLLKVNRTDAHPWNAGWGNGVHTWDMKVDASADINNLSVKNNANFSKNLNVNGNLTVNGNINLNLHLIKVKCGDFARDLIKNASQETYGVNDWILTIAGFNIDWNDRSPGAMKIYCYVDNNLWHIRSEIEFPRDDSEINILCIPRKYFGRVDNTGILTSGAGN